MELYSVMPLDMVHIDEVCRDIREQLESGCANRFLFSMTLVPEGNPPVDKATVMCKKYREFKKRLSGIPTGVLIQASMGHNWVLSEMFPYTRVVTRNEEMRIVCPYDEDFREYIYEAARTIAKEAPDFIMLDDDFRLLQREFGCVCDLHLSRVNELMGTSYSRDELLKKLLENEDKKLIETYIYTQSESLTDCAKVIRRGVDSVDKTIPMSYCCVSNNAENGAEIAKILAGEGNPTVVRINNGHYTAPGPRFLSTAFFRAAAQIAKIKDKVDVILAETDTCPQNRYSTSAAQLHAHFTGTILEGASGAKQWITRLKAYEPESGVAYRKKLAKYSEFYMALEKIVPTLSWIGFRMPVLGEARYTPKTWDASTDIYSAWGENVLERFGLPMYFSKDSGGIVCLEGDMDSLYTDSELHEMLKGNVILSSDSAEKLIARGFARYLGVEVKTVSGKTPSCEIINGGGETNLQMNTKELVPMDGAVSESTVYHTVDRESFIPLFAGSTSYINELGGTVRVFAGTPRAEYNLSTIFGFLNQSRKAQLVKILTESVEDAVYYVGDEEMYMKAARTDKGEIFCALFNIGLDNIEQIRLGTNKRINRIEALNSNGVREEVKFSLSGNVYTLERECGILEPQILFIS